MNIILLTEADWQGPNHVRLSDHRHQHLTQVLKATEGDVVKVGLLGGLRGSGVVTGMDNIGITLEVILNEPPPPRHPANLVLALPRPKMLRRVLRTCAEFGVDHIHLINSARVEKSFWQSPLLSEEKLREALIAGLERSGDTKPPAITQHRRFRPFVEDTLPQVANGAPIYMAHLGDYPTLAANSSEPCTIMIGPEGGFVPFEVELTQAQGATMVSLGGRILSVDTAVPAALARFM